MLAKVDIERSQVDSIESRTNPNNGEVEYTQKIWVYKYGSKHPTEYKIRLPSGVKLYPAGDYVLDLQMTMQPSQKYDRFDFDPWARISLKPATPEFLKAFDQLNGVLYSLYDGVPLTDPVIQNGLKLLLPKPL